MEPPFRNELGYALVFVYWEIFRVAREICVYTYLYIILYIRDQNDDIQCFKQGNDRSTQETQCI